MQPPVAPDLEDCCRSGCTPCVFDLYEEALERYEEALARHEAAQAAEPPERGSGEGGNPISSDLPPPLSQ